jgi:hypothetical protein
MCPPNETTNRSLKESRLQARKPKFVISLQTAEGGQTIVHSDSQTKLISLRHPVFPAVMNRLYLRGTAVTSVLLKGKAVPLHAMEALGGR